MSSVTHPHSERPSEHEELVAYLDGELSAEEARKVEERLANDVAYRQQLRDLDQAWEALGALPTTHVDDAFARTTIELACVAAEEDLTQKNSLAAIETRGRRRWWIAGAVSAAVIAFVMVRALAVHRNNMLLSDLPIITQVNALGLVRDVEFLQQLSAAGFNQEAAKKDPAFERELADFKMANSTPLDTRRELVNSLSPEQKAELADKTRAYEDLRQRPEEKERLHTLADNISHASNRAELEATLVAYGQWLRKLSPWKQEQLRIDFPKLSTSQQVATIERMVGQEKQQEMRQLSGSDKSTLRNAIHALVDKKKEELLTKEKEGQARDGSIDPRTNGRAALWLILRESDSVMDELANKLSLKAKDHFNRIPHWQYDQRRRQMLAWIHDALDTKTMPEDLEKFFADKVPLETRQKLLDMPKSEMDVALEKLYLRSELGIDERFPMLREFGEGNRGPRNPPRDGERPPGGRAEGRRGEGPPPSPDGFPRDERFGPDGPPPGFGPDGRPLGPPRPREEGPRRGNRPPRDRERPDEPPGPRFDSPPGEDGPPK